MLPFLQNHLSLFYAIVVRVALVNLVYHLASPCLIVLRLFEGISVRSVVSYCSRCLIFFRAAYTSQYLGRCVLSFCIGPKWSPPWSCYSDSYYSIRNLSFIDIECFHGPILNILTWHSDWVIHTFFRGLYRSPSSFQIVFANAFRCTVCVVVYTVV